MTNFNSISVDILEDFYSRLLCKGFNDPKIKSVIDDVRKDWAGNRPYINVKEITQNKINLRNDLIFKDYLAGNTVMSLSRRYQLSRKQIWKILKTKSNSKNSPN